MNDGKSNVCAPDPRYAKLSGKAARAIKSREENMLKGFQQRQAQRRHLAELRANPVTETRIAYSTENPCWVEYKTFPRLPSPQARDAKQQMHLEHEAASQRRAEAITTWKHRRRIPMPTDPGVRS